jgi:hypothetical protein
MAKKKKIDWDVAESLANIHCTQSEIMYVLGIDHKVTFAKHLLEDQNMSFEEWYAIHSSRGKASLRRKMYNVAAEDGNVPMLIWLSKQYLNMKEPAVELAKRKIEREEVEKLTDQQLEALARKIMDDEKQNLGGLKIVK